MKKIKAFINGIWEFRMDSTTSYDYPLIKSYGMGREIAHRVTLRQFEVNT